MNTNSQNGHFPYDRRVSPPFGKPCFPAYSPPDGLNAPGFLCRLVFEGLNKRYGKDAATHRPQVEEELGIINDAGYAEYFLSVWDILRECQKLGIDWITRGSAADSLVCYCLGISDVCPIRFDLYFRRFLNKDRMLLDKLPDIGIDFAHDRKDDVIDLIFRKYPRGQVAVVGGFSTYQAPAAPLPISQKCSAFRNIKSAALLKKFRGATRKIWKTFLPRPWNARNFPSARSLTAPRCRWQISWMVFRVIQRCTLVGCNWVRPDERSHPLFCFKQRLSHHAL